MLQLCSLTVLLVCTVGVADCVADEAVLIAEHRDVSSSGGSNVVDITDWLRCYWLVLARITQYQTVAVGSGGLLASITMLVGIVLFTDCSTILCKLHPCPHSPQWHLQDLATSMSFRLPSALQMVHWDVCQELLNRLVWAA